MPAGQVADESAVLQRRESSTAGNCRKSVSSRNFTSAFSPTQARSAQSAMSSCVISSTTSQSSFCALPPRTYLRTQWSAVCAPPRPALAASPQWSGQMRLSGARQAREQQGVARQAVAHGVVVWGAPPPCVRPQPLREVLRQPLRQQAVRLHLRKVAQRRVQDAPGLGHHAVLKAQDRVVDGHAELGHVLQAASISVAASTWLRAEMPDTMWSRARRPGPASRPAKPSGTSRAPRTATDSAGLLHKAVRQPRAQRRPPSTGWAGGRGRWPARCACSTPRPRLEGAAWRSGRTP